MNAFENKLSLSAEQKAARKAAAVAVADADKSVYTAIEIKHVQLKALWADEPPNKVMIMAKLAEVETLRRELIEAHVAAQLSFIASLSTTQQAEFRRLLKAMPAPRGRMQ
jgi:hypothetical protein